jgi:GNAT superfamily N-acetyltransferase
MTHRFLERFTGRVRYGLLMQEILDRVGRLGIRLTPYLVVAESSATTPDFQTDAMDYTIRPLSTDDMVQIANSPDRKRDLNKTLERLEFSQCIGIFVKGTLAGYSWSRSDRITRSGGRIELHALKPDEAYLFDMYIARPFRGMALAPLLRHHLYRHLEAEGVRRFYSITSYFNRSSRKFKAKLGARRIELRAALKLWSLMEIDFRLRRYEEDGPFGPKRLYLVRG